MLSGFCDLCEHALWVLVFRVLGYRGSFGLNMDAIMIGLSITTCREP